MGMLGGIGSFEFTEVEGQGDLLVAWVGGQCARIADQLPDEEVMPTYC